MYLEFEMISLWWKLAHGIWKWINRRSLNNYLLYCIQGFWNERRFVRQWVYNCVKVHSWTLGGRHSRIFNKALQINKFIFRLHWTHFKLKICQTLSIFHLLEIWINLRTQNNMSTTRYVSVRQAFCHTKTEYRTIFGGWLTSSWDCWSLELPIASVQKLESCYMFAWRDPVGRLLFRLF